MNRDKPHLWKADIAASVDFYNRWFMEFAPAAYRTRRGEAAGRVTHALEVTRQLRDLSAEVLESHPEILSILRASTAPPIARDRLVGLASVKKSLVGRMEKHGATSPRMAAEERREQLGRIAALISKLLDDDIFPWLEQGSQPEATDVERAATVVADRLCGAESDPIIRNEQERRQLAALATWLEARGYAPVTGKDRPAFDQMTPGTFTFRLNIPVTQGSGRQVNIPVDAAIMRKTGSHRHPVLVEAKSAGDVTNTNKRRKEEAQKVAQLRESHGSVEFVLFLCGYFDSGYLGYEAAEGLDWVWEHRIDDFEQLGI